MRRHALYLNRPCLVRPLPAASEHNLGIREETNPLAKGRSARNPSKEKSLGQSNEFMHEEELSVLGALEKEMIVSEQVEEEVALPILGGKKVANWKPGNKV